VGQNSIFEQDVLTSSSGFSSNNKALDEGDEKQSFASLLKSFFPNNDATMGKSLRIKKDAISFLAR
jgi:hypothetical protein